MKIVAIIPARGGSRGIPHKNVRIVAGRPLVAHVIAAACAARRVDRVIISTDAPDVAEAATAAGAEVVWRPAEISGDLAPSEAALLHTLATLRLKEAWEPDLVVFLQCTSPLTTADDIDNAIGELERSGADCALSVAPFYHFLWRADTNEGAVGINHDKTRRPMRQEREGQFIETGAIYVMRTAGFLAHRHRFFGRVAFSVTPPERCLEIDAPLDLTAAELRLRTRDREDRRARLPRPVDALVMDFDGIMTDNAVYMHQDGTEMVRCSRSDGWGLGKLAKTGLPVVVISSETNPVVRARCAKLGIACVDGVGCKRAALDVWCAGRGISLGGVVYLGHDENDLDCLRVAGCAVVPCDATADATALARIVLEARGGEGAVRELCEMILEALPAAGGPQPSKEQRP